MHQTKNEVSVDIERLESRAMMAGDVQAYVTGGDLVIRGDAQDNEIVIRATDQSDRYFIEGLNGTTVEGSALTEVVGVVDDVRINLRGGNNVLLLTREGIDGIESALYVADRLQIRTGGGSDLVVLEDVRVGGTTDVKMGGGDDTFAAARFSRLVGDVQVRAGAGNDLVGMSDSSTDGQFRVVAGSGDDDVLLFESIVRGNMEMRTGGGNDLLAMHLTDVNGDLRFNGGGGRDFLFDYDGLFFGATILQSVETEVYSTDPDGFGDLIGNDPRIDAIDQLIFTQGSGP